jgi:hypothetical protein
MGNFASPERVNILGTLLTAVEKMAMEAVFKALPSSIAIGLSATTSTPKRTSATLRRTPTSRRLNQMYSSNCSNATISTAAEEEGGST